MAGDPQAPARLHRRRRRWSWSALARHLLHRPGAAPADPDPRGEARSSSRPSSRPRRRSSPARARRSASPACAIGDIADVERRGRRRGGHVRHRPRVPADLPRRDDPDAPDDRPARTCSSSSTRARKAAGEFEEGDTIPVANTAPDVNLDEILAALDADTQAYLRAAARRRAARASRAATGTSASCSAASARSTATWPSSTARSRKRKREPRQPDPQPQRADRPRSGRHDDDLTAAGRRLQRRARRDRRAGPRTCSARSRLLPGTLEQATRTRSSATDAPGARCSARPSTSCARSPATSTSSTRSTRALAETATPVIRDEIRPVRARGARAGPRPAHGRRQLRRRRRRA